MIQANELRIDNYVIANGLYEGKIMQVDAITDAGSLSEELRVIKFKGKDVGEFAMHVDGIVLTPEILEKAGFKKDRNGWHLPGTQFSLTEKFYPCWLDRMLWPQDVDEFKERRLQCLHQLQNLFFELTRTELTINL